MLELPLEIFSAQKTYLKKKNIRFSVFPVSAHLQVVSTKAVESDLQGSFVSFHAGTHLAWNHQWSSLHKRVIYLVDIEEEVSEGDLAVGELHMVVSISCTHKQQSLLHKHLGEGIRVKKGLKGSVAGTFAVPKSLFMTKVLLAWITRSNITCKVQV